MTRGEFYERLENNGMSHEQAVTLFHGYVCKGTTMEEQESMAQGVVDTFAPEDDDCTLYREEERATRQASVLQDWRELT